jgi:hypothetical protein
MVRKQLLLMTALALIVCGCGGQGSSTDTDHSGSISADQSTQTPTPDDRTATPSTSDLTLDQPIGNPAEYFPMQIGARWEYRIVTPNTIQPYWYREETWPIDEDRFFSRVVRGVFMGYETGRQTPYTLAYHVTGSSNGVFLFSLAPGVQLAIDQDDFRVFDRTDTVCWKRLGTERFQVIQLTKYPADASDAPASAWGGWGQESGYALRFIFFGSKPGIAMGFGDNPGDQLYFAGSTLSPQLRFPGLALHFQRWVAADTSGAHGEGGTLTDAFTEDVWYVRDVGLVKLVQSIHDKPTMVWELVSFTKGSS